MNDDLLVRLQYGTDRHTKILHALLARYRLSSDKMNNFKKKWDQAEEDSKVYLPETDVDSIRKDLQEDGVPTYATIKVPYTYAIHLTLHTYMVSVFLARTPILQFTARHGEPEFNVQAVEALIDYQMTVGRVLKSMYPWLYDPGKYGYGILGIYWDQEMITSSRVETLVPEIAGIKLPGKEVKRRIVTSAVGYEGNRAYNVRPHDFFYDPRVSVANLQDGEFCGRYTEVNWNFLVEGSLKKRYFNIELVKRMGREALAPEHTRTNAAMDLPGEDLESSMDIKDIGSIDLIELYVKLIPRDWKLGTSERPEIWFFTIARKRIIIGAQPCGFWHGKFPFFALLHEIDVYSLLPNNLFEIARPLNYTMDWLLNSHFYNVRAALNNQFVVDPLRIRVQDLKNPNPGKIIRLREGYYGTDVRSVIQQLPVSDVTANHPRDMQLVGDLMQRVTGVVDNLMGVVNQKGNRTATEVRTSSSFSVNRLKTMAEWWSAADFSLFAQVLLQQTQQNYSLERLYKITGDLPLGGDPRTLSVSPDSIQGFYDFVPVDGTLPVDRYALANLWKEMLMMTGRIPQIASTYDIGGMFGWIAQLAGLKNIKQFKIQVMPNEALAAQAQAGNIVPTNQLPRGVNDMAKVLEPKQISGMGATG